MKYNLKKRFLRLTVTFLHSIANHSNGLGRIRILRKAYICETVTKHDRGNNTGNRNLNPKAILVKYEILNRINAGESCAAVAKKCQIAKQAISNNQNIYSTADANNTT